MKTLTKNSAEKRLAKLNPSKTSKGYQFAKQIIEGEKQIRPVHTSGRGRFCSNLDYTIDLTSILDRMGVEYIFTNDSPRGGLTGNLITITTKIKS